MIHEIDHHAPVTLIWLEEGTEPSAEMFSACATDRSCSPEVWPRFDQALRNAMHTHRSDQRQPWIKTNRGIISPVEIHKAYVPSVDEDY